MLFLLKWNNYNEQSPPCYITCKTVVIYSEYIHFCKHTNCFFFCILQNPFNVYALEIFLKLEELKNDLNMNGAVRMNACT